MKNKLKGIAILGIIVIIAIILIGLFANYGLEKKQTAEKIPFPHITDLKDKLGEETISTGTALMTKVEREAGTFYIKREPEVLDCLFIDDPVLVTEFSNAISDEITVKGTVEERTIKLYTPPGQPEQEYLAYCINVKEII